MKRGRWINAFKESGIADRELRKERVDLLREAGVMGSGVHRSVLIAWAGILSIGLFVSVSALTAYSPDHKALLFVLAILLLLGCCVFLMVWLIALRNYRRARTRRPSDE